MLTTIVRQQMLTKTPWCRDSRFLQPVRHRVPRHLDAWMEPRRRSGSRFRCGRWRVVPTPGGFKDALCSLVRPNQEQMPPSFPRHAVGHESRQQQRQGGRGPKAGQDTLDAGGSRFAWSYRPGHAARRSGGQGGHQVGCVRGGRRRKPEQLLALQRRALAWLDQPVAQRGVRITSPSAGLSFTCSPWPALPRKSATSHPHQQPAQPRIAWARRVRFR